MERKGDRNKERIKNGEEDRKRTDSSVQQKEKHKRRKEERDRQIGSPL